MRARSDHARVTLAIGAAADTLELAGRRLVRAGFRSYRIASALHAGRRDAVARSISTADLEALGAAVRRLDVELQRLKLRELASAASAVETEVSRLLGA